MAPLYKEKEIQWKIFLNNLNENFNDQLENVQCI